MVADLLTMLMWSALVIAGVGATAHLYRHMGAVVASQAAVMSLAALADALLLKRGINPTLSWIVAVGFGCGLGLVHLPVLLKTGRSLLLVLTVLGQFIMVELWYGLPGLTGGSGPLPLLGDISARAALVMLCLLIIATLAYLHFSSGSRARKRFDWACVQQMNVRAGAFGVPALRLYVLGFAIYGTMLGAAGVAGARYLGSLGADTFGLPLALAMLTIVLSGAGRPIFFLWLLSLLYCLIRVVLLRSAYASGNAAVIFEVSFPLLLLLLLWTRRKSLRRARPQEAPGSSPK